MSAAPEAVFVAFAVVFEMLVIAMLTITDRFQRRFSRLPAVLTLLLVAAGTSLCSEAVAQPVAAEQSDDLFLFRPQTPKRQVRGAVLAEKLDRPELARGYLKDLLDSNPPPPLLLDLRRKFGISVFLDLSAKTELQPESKALLQLINEAAMSTVPANAELETLVQQLGQSSAQTVDASLKLLSTPTDAAGPLLAADPQSPQGKVADQLLHKYVTRFQDGLLAALPDSEPETQVRILNLLKGSGATKLAIDLLRYQFAEQPEVAAAATSAVDRLGAGQSFPTTRGAAARALTQSASELISRAGHVFPTAEDIRDDRRLSDARPDEPLAYGAASLARAARLAASAARIVPEDPQVAAVLLVAELTEQAWPLQWPEEISLHGPSSDAKSESAADAVLALTTALKTDNAAAIFSVLSRTESSTSALQAEPVLLRQCQLHSDPRVRLLTAGIARSFGDQRRLTKQAIDSAISSPKQPEAIVIDPRSSDSLTVASVVNELDFATASARTGQAGLEKATSQLRCELVLVHSNCLRWSLSETIANLRADYRTQTVPIVIYGPERDRAATQTQRTSYAGVWFESEPISPLTFGDALRIQNIPDPLLPSSERLKMKAFAQQLP